MATVTHAAIGAAASGLATAAAHQAALDAATVTDVVAADMSSITKVVTVGTPALPADGDLRWNTTSLTGTGGPSRRLQAYDSAATDILDFANAIYSASTPGSDYQINGQLWFDMAAARWRVWRAGATYDAAIAGTGLDGWHPLGGGLMLVQNETGGDLTAGTPVAFAGTTGTRRVTKTTTAKQQNVAGVIVGATIATGANGLMATPSCSDPVTVYVNVTIGNVAAGDLIACSGTTGEAHTVGPAPASPFSAATQSATGTPCGAFAVALEDKAIAGTVMCRMLGYVGGGCRTTFSTTNTFRDLTPATPGYTNFFPLRSSTDTNGGQAATNDLLVNAKHGIPVSVDLFFQMEVDSATTALAVGMNFSKDGTNAEQIQRVKRYGTATLEAILAYDAVALKSDGSAYFAFVPSAAISAYTTWTIGISGYTY